MVNDENNFYVLRVIPLISHVLVIFDLKLNRLYMLL